VRVGSSNDVWGHLRDAAGEDRVMSRRSLLGVALVLIASLTACEHKVRYFCCTDSTQCENIVTCDAYPDRATCDMFGTLSGGDERTCVASPLPDAAPGCDDSTDCTAPTPDCLVSEMH
jgi:hypothetical protein